MLARPGLRTALKETAPGQYETGLLDAVKKRLSKRTPQDWSPSGRDENASQFLGIEAVLSSLLLASEDARRGSLSKETEQAFDRLWSLQILSGPSNGSWNWSSLDLDPYEEPYSQFYGASLAAVAVGTAPGGYQSRPQIQQNLNALKAYLAAQRSAQPLHNRLALVWASTKLPGLLSDPDRKAIVNEALEKQQADGGWTLDSLGAWTKHTNAPPSEGSNAYATGFATFVLERAGVSAVNPKVGRALDWLRSRQDAQSGFWDAQSMNKRYEPGSMQSQFMRDAATSFAALALLESR
jgi:squalene-hopene/tetraprenyl-beta-curcumene cyclase